MKIRGGRAKKSTSRSVLDGICPERWTFTDGLLDLLWVIEQLVADWPTLGTFLANLLKGPLIPHSELPLPTSEERTAPAVEISDGTGRMF